MITIKALAPSIQQPFVSLEFTKGKLRMKGHMLYLLNHIELYRLEAASAK